MKLFTLITLMICLGAPILSAESLVASVDFPVDSIKKSDLRKIFLGKIKTLDEHPVRPVLTPESAQLIKEILGIREIIFKRVWQMKVFSGEDRGLSMFKNTDDLIRWLLINKSCIAFLPQGKSIDDPTLKIIKIIKITE